MFLTFCLIFAISLGVTTCNDVPTYQCTEVQGSTGCQITGIYVNESMPEFELTAPRPDQNKELSIVESRVAVLTKDLCYTFPNLDAIILSDIGLQHLGSETFKSCISLRQLHLSYNQLTRIEDATFRTLRFLEILVLSNNDLQYFAGDTVKGLERLTSLAINSNDIFDINEEQLVGFAPVLKSIYLNDNNLRCKRIHEIKSFFASYEVQIMPEIEEAKERTAGRINRTIGGFDCLSDDQWNVTLHEGVTDPKVFQFLHLGLVDETSMMRKLYEAQSVGGSGTGNLMILWIFLVNLAAVLIGLLAYTIFTKRYAYSTV